MSKEFILVTGASSGLGEGFARALAGRGHNILLTARRTERLEKLCLELQKTVQCQVVASDLNDPQAPEKLFQRAQTEGWVIKGLVNNAGLGRQLNFADTPLDVVTMMLEVNMCALTKLTHLFLPSMIAQKRGFILNIASTAAFQPVPYFAVYAATKAYVLSFSEAVHEEAKLHGVHVSALCPGPVATEFQHVAKMEPRFFARSQQVDEVVAAGIKLLEKRVAVGWSSAFQRCFSALSSMAPRGVIRKSAAMIMRRAGAK